MEDQNPELIDIERSGVEGLRGYTYMGMTDGRDGRKKMQEEKREESRRFKPEDREERIIIKMGWMQRDLKKQQQK